MPRDTDSDWRHLAETNPYYAVIALDRFQAEQMDPARVEEFYETGDRDIAGALRYIRQRDPEFRATRALDFGCGVGRLALALAKQADQVVGLDVAPAMLAQARAAAAARGVENVRFTEALASDDRFDLINSLIVLQHIPPARGIPIIADLLGRLEIGGFCALQITLFRQAVVAVKAVDTGTFWSFDGERIGLMVEQDREPFGTMKMYDYDLNRVLALMVSHGIEAYAMEMTNHGGSHGVWLFGQRDPARYGIEANWRYTASGSDSFGRLLGSGWSGLEDWGVWTDGPEAIIEMMLPPGRTGAVRLEGRVFLEPERHPRLTISVDANGTPAAFEPVSAADPRAVLTIPAGLADARGALRLKLTIDRPMAPAAIGVNTETRVVGLGLEAVTLLG
jgi:SAM-dependent methyltransferase